MATRFLTHAHVVQALSYLEGSIQCAHPLQECRKDPAPLIFSRALFIMDHSDSALFHTLEDTVRTQNACALGILEQFESASPLKEQQQPSDGTTKHRNTGASTPADSCQSVPPVSNTVKYE